MVPSACSWSPPTRKAGSGVLSQEQVEHFERHGYVAIPDFFSAAEVDEFTRWVAEIRASDDSPTSFWKYKAMLKKDEGDDILDRIECVCEHHQQWRHTATSRRITDIVARLLACRHDDSNQKAGSQEMLPTPVLLKDKVNFKLAGGTGFATHQDAQAGWLSYADVHLNVAIHLDDSTPDNGCLKMGMPSRWHESGHRRELLGPVFGPIPDDVEQEIEWTSLPTKRTTLTIFDSFVLHQSDPNTTDKPRRIMFFTYQQPNASVEVSGWGKCIQKMGAVYAKYLEDKLPHAPPDALKQKDSHYRGYLI